MSWDEEKQHPVSQDGLKLWDTILTLQWEWCIPSDDPKLPTQESSINFDNVTIPSFQTNKKPAPATSTMVLSNPPISTVQPVSIQNNNLSASSTLNSQMSVLEYICQQVLQHLDALTTAGIPSNSQGAGYTSTLPPPSNPNAAQSALGMRD